MQEEKSFSLLNLGNLAQPTNALIEKVSAAIGGISKPWQIKRIAKARAEARVIEAETDIIVTDLHRRALRRFLEEEAKQQENMEEILRSAVPHLENGADPNRMEDDWITNFFDKSRIISDKDMQDLWAQVLAGEANSPGTYSKRTINLLGDMDKRDAELFMALCRFSWSILGDFYPLVFDHNDYIYKHNGVNFTTLTHLDRIGLIRYETIAGFVRQGLPKIISVSYYGKSLTLMIDRKNGNKELEVGSVLLSQAGNELSRVCHASPVEGFLDYVKEKWNKYLSKE